MTAARRERCPDCGLTMLAGEQHGYGVCVIPEPSAAWDSERKVSDARTPRESESLVARDGPKQCEEGRNLGMGRPCSCEALADIDYLRDVVMNPSHHGTLDAIAALDRLAALLGGE